MKQDCRTDTLAFTSSHLYPAPRHLDPSHAVWRAREKFLAALSGLSIQNSASELLRIYLPRTPVNRARTRGGASSSPGPDTPTPLRRYPRSPPPTVRLPRFAL